MQKIVMTGGTSGFGEITAKRLAASPGNRLLLGARGQGPSGIAAIPLDLAELSNVRAFATAVTDESGPSGIDALVLNAGMSPPDDNGRTPDGFETAFAVNHLAHYLLLRLLLPRLAVGATVVLTTSSTHDPEARTVITPPRHADARLLAHPEQDPQRDQGRRAAGGHAYSSSKLCNILTARAVAARPETVARQITVVAYDPGPTPGTNLLRNTPPAVRLGWRLLGTPLRRLVPRFNSQEAAGEALASLAMGKVRPPRGRIYGVLRHRDLTWPDPSQLARSDEAMEALWEDSAALVRPWLTGEAG